jgi:beta-lactamase regulating signal transducer with metallopeptidase domain
MNFLFDLNHYELLPGLEVLDLVLIAWGIGSAASLLRYLRQKRRCDSYYRQFAFTAEKHKVSEYLHDYHGKDYDVYVSAYVSCPMVIGFHKAVLMPAIHFDDTEEENIIRHEVRHIQNHDALVCLIANMLTIVY